MPLRVKIFRRSRDGLSFLGEHEMRGARMSIGRGSDCDLKLDDPEKRLSRVHLTIAQTAAGYRANVVSKINPIMINGTSQPPGAVVLLGDGDTLALDTIELQVRVEPEASVDPDATIAIGSASSYQAAREHAPAVPPAPAEIPVLSQEIIKPAPDGRSEARQSAWQLVAQLASRVRTLSIGRMVLALLLVPLALLGWMVVDEARERRIAAEAVEVQANLLRSMSQRVETEYREVRDAAGKAKDAVAKLEAAIPGASTAEARMEVGEVLARAYRVLDFAEQLDALARKRSYGSDGVASAKAELDRAKRLGTDELNVLRSVLFNFQLSMKSLRQIEEAMIADRKDTLSQAQFADLNRYRGMALRRINGGTTTLKDAGLKLQQVKVGTCSFSVPDPGGRGKIIPRMAWSGPCESGKASGRGYLRVYSANNSLRFVGDRTYSGGVLVQEHDAYMKRPGNAGVARYVGQTETIPKAAEAPAWAKEIFAK